MADWEALLLEPQGLDQADDLLGWFDAIAARLLTGTRLLVGSEPHRFTEVEFYYHGGGHLDPFTHRDPIQREVGRWYFHRTRGVYRGGSFKGFDLTFGGTGAFGGVLIRGLEKPDGTLVDGPSLCVDHLLARTEARDVATLDEAIEGRVAWDSESPLCLEWVDELADLPLLRSPRVGLSLKRLRNSPQPPRYVMRSYRYLSEPKRIAKGKLHMVLAEHARGGAAEQINKVTGCPRGTVGRYVADFEEGRREADFTPFWGIDLGPRDLCKLYGVWWAQFGAGPGA
jgi:hypothetical protein